jgi:hypothetical protein
LLPRTFADAVRIKRAMNIRYLWIDSLCIVQNDIVDWETEAAAMASIYGHSYFTIATTASKDSSEGCLRPRKPIALLPNPESEPTEPWHPSETLLVYPESTETLFGVLDAPLNTRSCAFQEQVLSCRTLDCCRDQWHCLERTVTEDGMIDISGYNTNNPHGNRYSMKLDTKFDLFED